MPSDFREELHPRAPKGSDTGGQFVSKGGGGKISSPTEWSGVRGTNPDVINTPLPRVKGKWNRTGVIIEADNGDVFLIKPSGGFQGGRLTFPKGGIEKGLTPQENAIKEAFEETGLQVEITGHVGDFERKESISRYYTARPVGGDTTQHDWEVESVVRVPRSELAGVIEGFAEKEVLAAYLPKIEQPQEFVAEIGKNVFRDGFTEVGGGIKLADTPFRNATNIIEAGGGAPAVGWVQRGFDHDELLHQARAACVTMGGSRQEFAAVIAVAGPEAKGKYGTRISIIEGDEGSVSVDSVTADAYGGWETGAKFELVHNHPKPYPLSGGDLRWLSEHPNFNSIEQIGEDGSWSRASMVRQPGVEGFELVIDGSDMNDFQISLREEKRYELLAAYNAEEAENGKEAAVLAATYMLAHATNEALDYAGVIKYEFKASPWQQSILDKHAGAYAEVLEGAKILSGIITRNRARTMAEKFRRAVEEAA